MSTCIGKRSYALISSIYSYLLPSIQALNNADVQKLEALTRWHRDTGDTVKWLRQNRHRFKMEIFEPPMLSISVPDKRFVNAIEACFSANDMQVCISFSAPDPPSYKSHRRHS
jgi:hypothetical protein